MCPVLILCQAPGAQVRVPGDTVEVAVQVVEGRPRTHRASSDDQIGGRDRDPLPAEVETDLRGQIEVSMPQLQPMEGLEVSGETSTVRFPGDEYRQLGEDLAWG